MALTGLNNSLNTTRWICTRVITHLMTEYSTAISTQIPSTESVTGLVILSALAALIGSLGNALVLLTVFKNGTLRKIPDFFITSLAFSDFTVCALFLPMSIHRFYQMNTEEDEDTFALTTKFIGHISMVASATNLFAVTIDRVIAIGFPFKYLAVVTKRYAAISIAVVWIISMTLGALITADLMSSYVIGFYSGIMLLNTIAMYIYVFVTAKRQENRIQNITTQISDSVAVEKKVAKTIFTVVGIYAISWLPTLLLPLFTKPTSIKFKQAFPWVKLILACNSALNPFLYCLRSQKYRLAFYKILHIHQQRP
ncbi:melanocortin receptor 3-like isoform X2 [Montipora capricornis]|uniref:melanocortin receptor 3-like isoform X2 n=1 Tax=Montipora capricornis TaxID=246305 RepID=UPI0035F1BA1C